MVGGTSIKPFLCNIINQLPSYFLIVVLYNFQSQFTVWFYTQNISYQFVVQASAKVHILQFGVKKKSLVVVLYINCYKFSLYESVNSVFFLLLLLGKTRTFFSLHLPFGRIDFILKCLNKTSFDFVWKAFETENKSHYH